MNNEIKLTTNEQYIVDLVEDACKRHPQHPTARIAGGWVRDKLMGKPSNDIDIMLDNATGSSFAPYIREGKTAVVKENPDRSKHLEVAICTIPLPDGDSIKVEFVNARKEVYKENSRIPSMQSATFTEDAFRRDLTINALFYNISTGEVEDPTGLGIPDLENGVVRAPGDPLIRYLEDPLRVFRTIRFAARYGFKIEPHTWEALCSPKVQQEVFNAKGGDGVFKLARERIGEEFLKMADGNNPAEAFQLLKDSGLFEKMIKETVNGTPYQGQMHEFELDQQNPQHGLN
jgi:tRNA nucleotidyltransferase (CCA-adding enzyme)